MRFTPRSASLAFAAALAFVPPATSQAQTLADAVACYGNVVANPAASGVSGVAVTLIKDDQVILRHGFGVVAPGSQQAVHPSTRFRIGSTLKGMTATALLSLADQRLPVTTTPLLNRPVQQLIPGFSLPGRDDWEAMITPRRLISHQGGLQDDNAFDGARDNAALLARFRDPAVAPAPSHAPGTIFNYSNANFMLAGAVVENASGRRYTQAMADRVFRPLGMNRMTFSAAVVESDGDFAFGISNGQVLGPNAYYSAAFAPAGLAWGSVDDLAQWARFLMKGNTSVLSPAYWQAMVTPQVNTFEFLDLERYGYGVFLLDSVSFGDNFYRGVQVREHGGNLIDYSSSVVTYPTLRVAMVVLANGNSADLGDCRDLALRAAVADRLPAPSPLPELSVRPDRFVDYVGAYDELVPDDRARIGRYSLSVNATTGDLEIEMPVLDQLGIPYSRTLFPVWRDAFVLVIGDTPLLLNGFRAPGATVGKTRLVKNRLFVNHRVSDQPGVYPSIVFKGTDQLAAQFGALKEQLQHSAVEQRAHVARLPANMRSMFNQATQSARAVAR
jgi:CubicO group peptidase (beta-lactamase class C family)